MAHCPCGVSFLLCFFRLLQRSCQLIGAGGGLAAAGCALQAGDNLVNIHTFNQGSDALQVAVAAADIGYIFDLSVLDLKVNFPGASSLGCVMILHKFLPFKLCDIYKIRIHESGQRLRIQDHLMAAFTGRNRDFIVENAGFIKMYRVFALQSYGAAAAADIAGHVQ